MQQDKTLLSVTGIEHGFMSRDDGIWKSDRTAEQDRNSRAFVLNKIGGGCQNLVTVKQVHGANVVTLSAPITGDLPEADAIVTTQLGLSIGIFTADCIPVLFTTRGGDVVAAAHAGWRGAFGGVLENTIQAMVTAGAKRQEIYAVIGPCIRQSSYEVDSLFRDRFLEQDSAHACFFVVNPNAEGKFMFDLAGYAKKRLQACDIAHIGDMDRDTLALTGDYHSYRRACLAGVKNTGRQISVIGVKGSI